MVAVTSKHPLYLVGIVLMFGGFVIFLAAFGSHKWASFEEKQTSVNLGITVNKKYGYYGLFVNCERTQRFEELNSILNCFSTANNEPFSVWAKVLQCFSVIAGIVFIISAVVTNLTPLNIKIEKWILVSLTLASGGFGILGAIVFGATFTKYITFSKLSWSFGVSLAGSGLELLAAILLICSPVLRNDNKNVNNQTPSTGQTSTISGKSEILPSCPTIQIGTTPVRWSPENPSLMYLDTAGSRTSLCPRQEQDCSYAYEFPTTPIHSNRPISEGTSKSNASPPNPLQYVGMGNQINSLSQGHDQRHTVSPHSQSYVAMGNPSVKGTRHSEPIYVNQDEEAGFGNHRNGRISRENNMAEEAGFTYYNNSADRDNDAGFAYYNTSGNRSINYRADDTRFADPNYDGRMGHPPEEEAPPIYESIDDGRIVFKMGKTSGNNYV